jgi:Helitron helicase-like domain at N-terminus
MEEAADLTVKDIFRYKVPASFMSSRAWCSNHVPNVLAIARQLGKPSFCRDDKPAVARDSKIKLQRGQNVFDAPAAANRTFHGRLDRLKTFLRQRFGGLLHEIRVVEFQKRGLPHARIIVKFNTEPPSFTSAEIPDPRDDNSHSRPPDPPEFPL